MEFEISTGACDLSGKRAILGVLSIGSPHQFVKEFIRPCVTDDYLAPAGKQHCDDASGTPEPT